MRSEWAKNVFLKQFTGDFHGVSTRFEGRFDFVKSPKSNPPLQEGRLDFSKSPRSNPPLLEGPLEISKRPRSMGGGTRYWGGVLQSDAHQRGEVAAEGTRRLNPITMYVCVNI